MLTRYRYHPSLLSSTGVWQSIHAGGVCLQILDAPIPLVEVEVRFSQVFSENSVPMPIVNTSSLRFVDVNAAACAQYGYTRAQF